jgi:proteasome beta subunit
MEAIDKNTKKGTTTLALVCKDGVVVAADKRASMGYLIANKQTDKIFKVSDSIALTMAGSAADGQKLADYLKAELDFYRLNKDQEPILKVASALMSNIIFGQAKTFIPYFVQIILAGENDGEFSIYTLDMGGSSIKEDKYFSTGSGSPMAFGVLEDNWKPGMSLDDGVDLAKRAVMSAIKRDMASGSGIDIVVIDKKGFRKVLGKEITHTLK